MMRDGEVLRITTCKGDVITLDAAALRKVAERCEISIHPPIERKVDASIGFVRHEKGDPLDTVWRVELEIMGKGVSAPKGDDPSVEPIAATSADGSGRGWQSMETVPDDEGAEFMLWVRAEHSGDEFNAGIFRVRPDGVTVSVYGYSPGLAGWTPLAWHPMPAPPQGERRG